MKCIHCNAEIEEDDNFCPLCGHWTIRGYTYYKKNGSDVIIKGPIMKQHQRFKILIYLLTFSIIIFVAMLSIRGEELTKPIAYLQKNFINYFNGYNTSIIKVDNKYNKVNVNSYSEAINLIKKDFREQTYLCNQNIEINKIEQYLEETYAIPSVTFCDLSLAESQNLQMVIKRMYELFPNVKGALTNISIAKASSKDEYIAYFQPMYQFVNVGEDINYYNKVNKTQILLNDYYFLNPKISSSPIQNIVGNDWYVEDATWESTLAHEFGHYITFFTFLKENNLLNITFVTKENDEEIQQLLDRYSQESFTKEIVEQAKDNYNSKYQKNLSLDQFSKTISKYANYKNQNKELITSETIAEAIHDYYLHDNNMKASSQEIIKIIKEKLKGDP